MNSTIIKRFMQSPLAKKMLAEEVNEKLATRRENIKAIERARKKLEKELPGYNAAITTQLENVEAAKAALKSAEEKLLGARQVKINFYTPLDRAILVAEGELEQSADPAIDRFLKSMFKHWEEMRQYPAAKNIKEVLRANGRACERAKAMKLEVNDSVEAELNRLRESIQELKQTEVAA